MTLTSEQLSVFNLVSGRHLVLAPPGSGKTEMLSQRIVRALGSGVDPTKMLCATFTNRAAFEMRDRVAALEYFKSGLQISTERQAEIRSAIGDFVYHRSGTLRLDAATCLAVQGITRWNGIIRGASTDFVRLESAADAEHEETIRAILAKKDLPEEYERRLRMIIFARAKRNPKD